MGRIDELVSAEFANWEQRGRGWRVWPEAVRPEPPFEEFTGYRLSGSHLPVDDGRRPSLLASLFDSIEQKLNAIPPSSEEGPQPEPSPTQNPLSTELVVSLPASLKIKEAALRGFLDSLHVCPQPTAFEILGTQGSIKIQFAAGLDDAVPLRRQLTAFF